MQRPISVAAEHPTDRPIARLVRPFARFASAPYSGGLVLLAFALAALLWANSPWWHAYQRFEQFRIDLGWTGQTISHPLHFWINDGLMTIFFLLVGLEIKREMLVGELSERRQAALPIAAAFGGVLIPALIYTAINWQGPGHRGWGIPMATDIAFAVGAITLLGRRIPPALSVFLTALAIVDDLVAVLVIALFYTETFHVGALAIAGSLLLVLLLMNRLGVSQPAAYVVPGVALWAALLESGVHATIAGVLLALTIPARRFYRPAGFLARARELLAELASGLKSDGGREDLHEELIEELEEACRHVQSPLHRIESALGPWVSFGIMPLFAFANAGVRVVDQSWATYLNPITVGVFLGLFLGKPAGILLFSWLTTKWNWAELPDRVGWRHIHGAAWLAGIGFTMSLFIGGLAFGDSPLLEEAKVGIIGASVLAGITGSLFLRQTFREISPAPPVSVRR